MDRWCGSAHYFSFVETKHVSRSKIGVIPCRCSATLRIWQIYKCAQQLLHVFCRLLVGSHVVTRIWFIIYTWIPLTWGNVMRCDYATTFVAEMQQPNAAPHCVEFWSICSMSILCSQIYIFKDVSGMGLFMSWCFFWGEMKCAIWLWNEEQAAEFLKEVCDAKVGHPHWEPGEGMDPFTGPFLGSWW